jgi:hypothetical protein
MQVLSPLHEWIPQKLLPIVQISVCKFSQGKANEVPQLMCIKNNIHINES